MYAYPTATWEAPLLVAYPLVRQHCCRAPHLHNLLTTTSVYIRSKSACPTCANTDELSTHTAAYFMFIIILAMFSIADEVPIEEIFF